MLENESAFRRWVVLFEATYDVFRLFPDTRLFGPAEVVEACREINRSRSWRRSGYAFPVHMDEVEAMLTPFP